MKTTCLNIPRFVKEYGNYLKKSLTKEGKDQIDNVIWLLEKGYISIPDTMELMKREANKEEYISFV